jgi:hypothetical protein
MNGRATLKQHYAQLTATAWIVRANRPEEPARLPEPTREPIPPRVPVPARQSMPAREVTPRAPECHRYSSVTCPNRQSTCLSLNLPISKSVVRLNATEPAWPNIFQSPCARCIAAAGLGHSIGSPAAMLPSIKSHGIATKEVISVIGSGLFDCLADDPGQSGCLASQLSAFSIRPLPPHSLYGGGYIFAARLHGLLDCWQSGAVAGPTPLLSRICGRFFSEAFTPCLNLDVAERQAR